MWIFIAPVESQRHNHMCHQWHASKGETFSDLELGDVMDLRYGNSFRVAGRVCCVQAVNISQQEQPISLHQSGHLQPIMQLWRCK